MEYGENLAWHSRETTSCYDLIKMWYDEVNEYDFNKAKFDHETGHFTQLVWRSTKSVGCAKAISSGPRGGVYLVCNYDPPGNFLGEESENVLVAIADSVTAQALKPTTIKPAATTTTTTSAPITSTTKAPTTTTTTSVAPTASSGSADATSGGGSIANKKKKNNSNKNKKNKKTDKSKRKKKGNKNKKNKNKRRNKKKGSSTSTTTTTSTVATTTTG